MRTNPDVQAANSITVVVERSPLVARISGCDLVSVPYSSRIPLDCGLSDDPDDEDVVSGNILFVNFAMLS